MSARALATIETVTSVEPIPDADQIEAARVRGWTVVVRKGEFTAGDQAVYFEIDSFLPLDKPQFAFLAPRGARTQDGVRGHVLRTAKLRGVVSQGLLLPPDAFDEVGGPDGTDVTERLGITKWDPPIPAELSGAVAGPFPTNLVRKTDAERVQNFTDDELGLLGEMGTWVATEKADGTSCTIIGSDDGIRVCGRNWELAPPAEGASPTTMWRLAGDIEANLDPGQWLQAEVIGEGIQSNPLKIKGHRLVVFGYGIVGEGPTPRADWPEWIAALAAPVYDFAFPRSVDDAIDQVDGIDSLLSPGHRPEGIVWHDVNGRSFDLLDGRSCFKVISNRYLLKNQD
jgi:RNA ligase (TIGR02306 family)